MRYQKAAVLILAAPLAAFALEARHPPQDSQGQATQDQSKPCGSETLRSGKGMMDRDIMPSRMMARHQQMQETMNKLMESITALENETDPAALKSKLTEHRALLEQMRKQIRQQGTMQSMMQEIGSKTLPLPPRPRVWK